MKILKLIWIIWFGLLASAYAQGIKITMEAHPNPANINSQIAFQVSISGQSTNLPDIPTPNLKNFKIISGPATSTSIQMINFKSSMTKSYTWYLLPKKTGTFTIPAVRVKWKGKNYAGNDLKISVKPAGQSTTNNNKNKKIFLKAELDKKSVYPNEQVNLVYKLYVRTRVETYEIIDSPDLKGFWTEKYPASGQGYQEIVNGVRYTVYDLEKTALFPLQEGNLSISPLRIKTFIIERSKRRSNDPFDIFNDMSIFGGQRREIIVASNPIDLKVKKMPPEPAQFVPGLVGKLNIRVNRDQFKGKSNEALSLKIEIEGNAYLKAVKSPDIKFPDEFEVYDPKIDEKYNLNGSEYFGRKTFEYIIIPRKEGRWEISPPILYSFDPEKKKYIKHTLPKLIFDIEKNNRKVFSNTYNKNAGIQLEHDIRFIREKTTLVRIKDRVFWKSSFYLVLLFMVLFLWALYAINYRRINKLAADKAYLRQKTAGRLLKKRLSKASKALRENDWDLYLDELNKALTGFIGDRCMKSTAGLTTEDALRILAERNLPQNLVEEVSHFFHEIDFIRYAPNQNKKEKMSQLLDEAGKIIVALQKYV